MAILVVLASVRLSRAEDNKPSPTAPSCQATDALAYNEWCDPAMLQKAPGASIDASDVLVCVQAANGCLLDIKNSLRAQVIPPNRAIVVAVHTCGDSITSIGIGLGGTAGETVPGVFTSGLLKSQSLPPRPTCDNPRVYVSTFAPRTAGAATLTVTKTVTPPASTTTYGYELFIPSFYSGALRIGLGAGWVHNLGHNYNIRKVPGTDFSDVVDSGAAPLAVDLVIGYAPFLFDRDDGGRYYGLLNSRHSGWAPYFALSAISANASGKVDWLRAVYVGLERELVPGSSLAFGLIGRRVDALANGLRVGAPIADETTLTKTTYELGIGVVFNFTPFFFQFATSALPK